MTEILNTEKLFAYKVPQAEDEYDPRDAILYALGVGAGLCTEIDEASLLYERDLQVLPTMALVLGTPGFWPMDPSAGLDWQSVLQGEQRLKIHEPLDPFGTMIGDTSITDIADKGFGKSALVRAEKQLRTPSGLLVAEASEVWIIRGSGGFGGKSDLPGDPLPPTPVRDPDFEVMLPTSRVQAATYRLSGDRNPLHIDQDIALNAGFERPILHGLSTMGLVARAIIHACSGGIAQNLREIGLRFTAPVYPGDMIRTHIWQEGDTVHFRADAIERGTRVIDQGLAKINAAAI